MIILLARVRVAPDPERGRAARSPFGFFARRRALGHWGGHRLCFDRFGYITEHRFNRANFENGALFTTDSDGDGANSHVVFLMCIAGFKQTCSMPSVEP